MIERLLEAEGPRAAAPIRLRGLSGRGSGLWALDQRLAGQT